MSVVTLLRSSSSSRSSLSPRSSSGFEPSSRRVTAIVAQHGTGDGVGGRGVEVVAPGTDEEAEGATEEVALAMPITRASARGRRGGRASGDSLGAVASSELFARSADRLCSTSSANDEASEEGPTSRALLGETNSSSPLSSSSLDADGDDDE